MVHVMVVHYVKSLKKSKFHNTVNHIFCGSIAVKREVVGIWKCTKCKAKIAGGAYQLSNPAAVTIRTAIARLRAKKDSQAL